MVLLVLGTKMVQYKKGKREGKKDVWYENGQKSAEIIYKDGEEKSRVCWNEQGKKKKCP